MCVCHLIIKDYLLTYLLKTCEIDYVRDKANDNRRVFCPPLCGDDNLMFYVLLQRSIITNKPKIIFPIGKYEIRKR